MSVTSMLYILGNNKYIKSLREGVRMVDTEDNDGNWMKSCKMSILLTVC